MDTPANRPQKIDSLIRSATTAALALILVCAVVAAAFVMDGNAQTAAVEAVKAAALIVVGFYFGGHVAVNTAALEEVRLRKSTDASEASALRSETAARKSERRPAA